MTINTSLRPGPKGQAIIARDDQLMSGSMIPRYPFVMDHGSGARVWDVDGNEYIDFAAGLAVTSTGHSHPAVVKAITEQAQKFIHIAGTDYYYEVQVKLAEKLSEIAPFQEDARVFLANSGAETVEAAVKLARWYTGRSHVIAFFGAFHGRTMGALSLTASKVVQRDGFFPLIPGVYHVPYNNPYRCLHGREESACQDHCICADFIEDVVFKRIFPGDSVAAIIMEPISGRGRLRRARQPLRPAIARHLRQVRDHVDRRRGAVWHGAHRQMVGDPASRGRAGHRLLGEGDRQRDAAGRDHRQRTRDELAPGAHGTTFGGNPVSCAAALVTIDLIERGYMANAAEQGAYILDALEELRPHHPTMQHARIDGKGLMIGLELVLDEARTPAKEIRNRAERCAIDNGLLLLGAGDSALRFIPPLIIERDLVDEGLKRFDQSLTQAEQEAGLL